MMIYILYKLINFADVFEKWQQRLYYLYKSAASSGKCLVSWIMSRAINLIIIYHSKFSKRFSNIYKSNQSKTFIVVDLMLGNRHQTWSFNSFFISIHHRKLLYCLIDFILGWAGGRNQVHQQLPRIHEAAAQRADGWLVLGQPRARVLPVSRSALPCTLSFLA